MIKLKLPELASSEKIFCQNHCELVVGVRVRADVREFGYGQVTFEGTFEGTF